LYDVGESDLGCFLGAAGSTGVFACFHSFFKDSYSASVVAFLYVSYTLFRRPTTPNLCLRSAPLRHVLSNAHNSRLVKVILIVFSIIKNPLALAARILQEETEESLCGKDTIPPQVLTDFCFS
jgi:hypothetical protein